MLRDVPRCPDRSRVIGSRIAKHVEELRRGSTVAHRPRTTLHALIGRGVALPMLTAISTAFHKGGWGMWPILFTSVLTIAVIVERAVYLFRASVDKDKLLALLKSQVMSGNVQGAIKVCSGNPTPMTRIVQAGLMKFNKSDDEVQAAMDEAALRELPKINARTPYLAMTANFAVMAGLLGTISGMIKSFGSVGGDEGGNKATILAEGIAEALNCTAFGIGASLVGLLGFSLLSGKTTSV